jgi:glucokinase
MNGKYIIGIDLGGTKISGAVSTFDGKIIYKKSIDTLSSQGPEIVTGRILGHIKHLIEYVKADKDEISGIGIASPGPLNIEEGIIVETPNLPFRNYPLIKTVERETGIKAYLENDANAAALGELWFGAGRGSKNFIYMTVSTGIGGGIVINGDIYHGHTGNAGEFGHMTVEPHGPRCNCGNYGCLEVMSSGTAIARIANERLKAGENSMLRDCEKVTSKEVFEYASKGDKLSCEIVDYTMNYLGIGTANLVNAFDPELIIIGGGVSKAGDALFSRVKNVVSKRCFEIMAKSVKIIPPGLSTDAGLVGALAVIMSKYKSAD